MSELLSFSLVFLVVFLGHGWQTADCGQSEVENLIGWVFDGPAGPVSIRFHYACLCGGPRIDPVSPVSSFTL